MKKLILLFTVGTMVACASPITEKDFEESTKINKTFTVQPNSTLAIYNLNGSIEVEAYEGNEVVFEIQQTISAETQADLTKGIGEFKIGFDQKADSLIAYLSAPWDTRPKVTHNNWQNHERIQYDVHLEFKVKVPKSLNLRASTINHGEVLVKNVGGNLHINNVNGGIEIVNAKATTRAHTVNGPVKVSYLKNPPESSSYHTINGDIEVTYLQNLSADLSFKSMNGEYFTDFENYKVMPSEVEENKSKAENRTKYKVSSRSPIRIGEGGTKLKFETLNGNIYIKKS